MWAHEKEKGIQAAGRGGGVREERQKGDKEVLMYLSDAQFVFDPIKQSKMKLVFIQRRRTIPIDVRMKSIQCWRKRRMDHDQGSTFFCSFHFLFCNHLPFWQLKQRMRTQSHLKRDQTCWMLNLELREERSLCCFDWLLINKAAVGEIVRENLNLEGCQENSGKQLWRASAREEWNRNNFLPPLWITSFLDTLYQSELWRKWLIKAHWGD